MFKSILAYIDSAYRARRKVNFTRDELAIISTALRIAARENRAKANAMFMAFHSGGELEALDDQAQLMDSVYIKLSIIKEIAR